MHNYNALLDINNNYGAKVFKNYVNYYNNINPVLLSQKRRTVMRDPCSIIIL